MSLFLLACSRRKPDEKEEEQKLNCKYFKLYQLRSLLTLHPDNQIHLTIVKNCKTCINIKSHPNATSSTIITVNPSIAPIVERSVSFPICDSGISSSTTTKIIAPAAKESA